MLLAVDTHYAGGKAHTVALLFEDWQAAAPAQVREEVIETPAAYEPGAFHKRELPCILHLLGGVALTGVGAIVVDGYVHLDDARRPGLGARLHEALNGRIPVVGVAKTHFATVHGIAREVRRGTSQRPLYVTAAGMDVAVAAACVARMHGTHRIPDLLKLLDRLSRKA